MLVLILRSAHAEDVPQTRTRVRASRRMRTSHRVRPLASRRIAAYFRLGKQLRSGRAARLLSIRAITTNLRVCEIIASVSALLFTGKIATRACPPHRGGKIASADRGGDAHARLSGLRAS